MCQHSDRSVVVKICKAQGTTGIAAAARGKKLFTGQAHLPQFLFPLPMASVPVVCYELHSTNHSHQQIPAVLRSVTFQTCPGRAPTLKRASGYSPAGSPAAGEAHPENQVEVALAPLGRISRLIRQNELGSTGFNMV